MSIEGLISSLQYCRGDYQMSISLKMFLYDSVEDLTFFKCPSRNSTGYYDGSSVSLIPCLGVPGFQVYAVYSLGNPGIAYLPSCSKMYNVAAAPYDVISSQKNATWLTWTKLPHAKQKVRHAATEINR
ncbi:hypothetical protein AAG906_025452 [Vitis piasezkii]